MVTGSVGVIFVKLKIIGLMEKIGVSVNIKNLEMTKIWVLLSERTAKKSNNLCKNW
jgi:ClpP class serine protease